MKSFYLYALPAASPITIDDSDLPELNALLTAITSGLHIPFSDLKVRLIETIQVAGNPFHEISYSYVTDVNIIDPDTESSEMAKDLQRGFIWISEQKSWLAVCAKDETVAGILVEGLVQHNIIHSPARLSFWKLLLQRIEHDNQVRRATLRDPETGTNRRWTNVRLSEDSSAMQEFQARDQRDERPSAGYNQQLPDGTDFALGYTSAKGRIFFQRDMTVTQMRSWGTEKIDLIVSHYNNLMAESSPELQEEVINKVLQNMSEDKREAIRSLSAAFIQCKRDGLSEIPLPLGSEDLFLLLGDLVKPRLKSFCEICDHLMDVHCKACGNLILAQKDMRLTCKSCSAEIGLTNIECPDGHQVNAASLQNILEILPTPKLTTSIARIVAESSRYRLNYNEDVIVIRDQLFIYTGSGGRIEYTLDDIPELSALVSSTLDEAALESAKNLLAKYKEKCAKSSKENCAKCVSVRVGEKCYLRLFGLWDSEYSPTPHHGDEYGDYRRTVTIDGVHQKQLVVLMKSGKPSASEVRLRHEMGRDIHTQFAGYLRNSSIDIIGIAVPKKLDPQFVSFMRQDARQHNKRLLLLDQDGLSRIVASVLELRGIRPDDL